MFYWVLVYNDSSTQACILLGTASNASNVSYGPHVFYFPKLQGGGAGWSRSSNYTMTVSVIVPLVISVFLLVILCVLFFLIRRCHNARAQELDRDAGIIPTISAGLGRRSKGNVESAFLYSILEFMINWSSCLLFMINLPSCLLKYF